MKKQIVNILSVLGFAALFATPAFAEDLSALIGKWSVQKTNEDGQRYVQSMELKKDKFIFKVSSPEGETQVFAEGDMKLDKTGPFKTIVFSNIKAGQSSSDTNPLDDTYVSIYKLGDDDTLLMVMNFDKDRDEPQKPRLDVYRKAKETKQAQSK